MHNVATRQPCDTPSRCGGVVAQRDGPAWLSRHSTTQPRRTVLLKADEWSGQLQLCTLSECPASSYSLVRGRDSNVEMAGQSAEVDSVFVEARSV